MDRPPVIEDSLTHKSKVDVVVTKSGALWFLHDMPLEHSIAWVEYDPDSKSLTIITDDGASQDLGMNTTDVMEPYLSATTVAHFGLVQNSRVEAIQEAPVTIHQSGGY
jgi:hypothetical protein